MTDSRYNRLALFDCDGTLVDSQHSIVEAMSRAFSCAGLEPPARQDVLSIIGLSLPHAVARLLPDGQPADHAYLVEHYKLSFHEMRRTNCVSEPLYPGIAELIAALDADGWMLGVATGKSDRGLTICLTSHGLLDRFVTLQTADRHPGKPHPSMALQAMAEAGAAPQTTVMIGDTSFDMAMAVNAGIRGIGVPWGYHPSDLLIDAGAYAVAMDSADLARHIAAL